MIMQNLSINKIAKELGITRQAVQNWYSGLSNPTMENLIKLSIILDTDVNGVVEHLKTQVMNRSQAKNYIQE